MKEVVIASGNAHKVEEFVAMLDGPNVRVRSANDFGGMPEVEESGTTFVENARLKAEALRVQVGPGRSVLADDSGLEVDALDGAPGAYSARFAGIGASDKENRSKLLDALEGKATSERTARFRCVLCWIDESGDVQNFDGACEGLIAETERGDQGFGYDALFIPEGYSETFGELGDSVKSKLSHRARALQKLRDALTA